MSTPMFCVSTKPGKAACRTRCPPQDALSTTLRSGPGLTDPEGTLGPLPPPWRRHTPSRPCARSPAVEAAFLGLNLNSASISTACSHQGEMEGPCLALHALPGQTRPQRGARPGLSQRSALIYIRTCSVAAPPCIQPRPGSFPGRIPSSLRHHGACSPSQLRASVTAVGKPCLSLEEPPPPPTVPTAPGTQLTTGRPRHRTGGGNPSVSTAPHVAPARPILHKHVLKEQTEKGQADLIPGSIQ